MELDIVIVLVIFHSTHERTTGNNDSSLVWLLAAVALSHVVPAYLSAESYRASAFFRA